jgi:FMN phosphatase YigB (HAD superfamily)
MSVPKPILFIDFDGTLCHDRFWRSLPTEQYEKVQKFLFGDDKTHVQEWMLGKRTAEEINEMLAKHMGVPFQELWDVFVQDANSMKVSQESMNAINNLRDRYTTVLITVNMDSFSRFTVPASRLNDYFDAISNSYDEGLFKSDNGGEVFKKYIHAYQAPVADSVLIDDSPSACATFSSLGGISRQVTRDGNLTYHLNQISEVSS